LLNPAAMTARLLLLASLVGLPVSTSASEYDPPSLYDVDYFKLLGVILKKQTHAHNVAVRLVVNMGQEAKTQEK
jgi:hypothetical protein